MPDTLQPFNDSTTADEAGDFFLSCISSLERSDPARVEGEDENTTCLDYFIKHANYRSTKRNTISIEGTTYSPTRAILDFFFNNEFIPDVHAQYCSRDGEMVSCIDSFVNMIMFERQWTRDKVPVVLDFLWGIDRSRIDFAREECHNPDGELVSCLEVILDSINYEHRHNEFTDLYPDYVRAVLSNSNVSLADTTCHTADGGEIGCMAKVMLSSQPAVWSVVDNLLQTNNQHFMSELTASADKPVVGADGIQRSLFDALLETYNHRYWGGLFLKANDPIYTIITDDGTPVKTTAFNKILDMVEDIAMNDGDKYFSDRKTIKGTFYPMMLNNLIENPEITSNINIDGCIRSDGTRISCVEKIMELKDTATYSLASDMYRFMYQTFDISKEECEHADGYVTSCLNLVLDRPDMIPLIVQNQNIDLTAPDCIDEELRPISCIDKIFNHFENTMELVNERYQANIEVVNADKALRDARWSPRATDEEKRELEKAYRRATRKYNKTVKNIKSDDFAVINSIMALVKNQKYDLTTTPCHDTNNPNRTVNCLTKILDIVQSEPNTRNEIATAILSTNGKSIDARRCTDSDGNKITCFQRLLDAITASSTQQLMSTNQSMIDRMFDHNCRVFVTNDETGVSQSVPVQGLVYLLYKIRDQPNHSIKNVLLQIMMHDKYHTLPDSVTIGGEVFSPSSVICDSISMTDIHQYLGKIANTIEDVAGIEDRRRSLSGKALQIFGKCKCKPEPFPEPFEVLSKTQINKRLKSKQWTNEDLEKYKAEKRDWETRKAEWEAAQVINTRTCHDKLCYNYTHATQPKISDRREWVRADDPEWGMTNLIDPYGLCGVYSVINRANVSEKAKSEYEQKFYDLYHKISMEIGGMTIDIDELNIHGMVIPQLFMPENIMVDSPTIRISVIDSDTRRSLFTESYSFKDLVDTIQERDEKLYKTVGDRIKGKISGGTLLKEIADLITSKPASKDSELKLVISRRPYDMLRASSCQHWSSCFDLHKDVHARSIKIYMDHGGYIAYLASDELSPVWHARMWILPTEQKGKVCFTTQTVYGLYKDLMHDAVNAILHEKGYNTPDCYSCAQRSNTKFPWDHLRTRLEITGYNRCVNDDNSTARCTAIWKDYLTPSEANDYKYAPNVWVDCPNHSFTSCDHANSPAPRIGENEYNAILKRRNPVGKDGKSTKFVDFVSPLVEYAN